MAEDFRKIHTSGGRAIAAIAIVLCAILLYAGVLFFLFDRSRALGANLCGQSLLLIFALVVRCPAAVHMTLLGVLRTFWSRGAFWPRFWPLEALVPVIVYAAIVVLVPALRKSVRWFRRGEMNRSVWVLTGITILLSSSGLVLWFFFAEPDLNRFLPALPTRNPFLLIPVGLGFSLVNAAVEESIYRGVMLEALDSALGPGMYALVFQAAAFGLAHFKGVPNGWIGVGMATGYGLMLGVIRYRGKGMLAPFVAHVCADGVIFGMLIFRMLI